MLGIIGAMTIELELLYEKMIDVEIKNISGFEYRKGFLNNKHVVVTCCGVGKVNAAACTQTLINEYKVNQIINTGIAGGLRPEVKIGDIVLSTNVTYHDVNPVQMTNLFPNRKMFLSDEKLTKLASDAFYKMDKGTYKCHTGRIVTGDHFINSNSEKSIIIENYDPHCVEMEGGAIGHVSFINNIPFLVIRSISDEADENADVDYKEFESFAANRSAEIVCEIAKGI